MTDGSFTALPLREMADALDRFGTRLEHRFSRSELQAMMERCGLIDIRFREEMPHWVACGIKAGTK